MTYARRQRRSTRNKIAKNIERTLLSLPAKTVSVETNVHDLRFVNLGDTFEVANTTARVFSINSFPSGAITISVVLS